MREYGKIATRFWTDPKVLGLSPTTKLAFVYLLSGPETNLLGCFRVTALHLVANDVCSQKEAETAFADLNTAGLIKYDRNSKVAYLPNFLKYNPVCNPSSGKAAATAVKSLPDNAFMKELVERLTGYNDHMPKNWSDGVDTSADTCVDTSVLLLSHQDPIPSRDGSKKVAESAPSTSAGAEAVVSADRIKEKKIEEWTDALKAGCAEDDLSGAVVDFFIKEMDDAFHAYYGSRGGRWTLTRRAWVADRLSGIPWDRQLVALEFFCDKHGGSKDEKYLNGIARRLGKLSEDEVDADVGKHRKMQNGRGLFSAGMDVERSAR